jgi:hypothetical protein
MSKIVCKPFCCGEKWRLRDYTYEHTKVREWLFFMREGEKIFLEHKTKGYVWEVRMDDIDWEAFQKTKAFD